LASRGTTGFSVRTLLHVVSYKLSGLLLLYTTAALLQNHRGLVNRQIRYTNKQIRNKCSLALQVERISCPCKEDEVAYRLISRDLSQAETQDAQLEELRNWQWAARIDRKCCK
jgi:hypothetical protein